MNTRFFLILTLAFLAYGATSETAIETFVTRYRRSIDSIAISSTNLVITLKASWFHVEYNENDKNLVLTPDEETRFSDRHGAIVFTPVVLKNELKGFRILGISDNYSVGEALYTNYVTYVALGDASMEVNEDDVETIRTDGEWVTLAEHEVIRRRETEAYEKLVREQAEAARAAMTEEDWAVERLHQKYVEALKTAETDQDRSRLAREYGEAYDTANAARYGWGKKDEELRTVDESKLYKPMVDRGSIAPSPSVRESPPDTPEKPSAIVSPEEAKPPRFWLYAIAALALCLCGGVYLFRKKWR